MLLLQVETENVNEKNKLKIFTVTSLSIIVCLLYVFTGPANNPDQIDFLVYQHKNQIDFAKEARLESTKNEKTSNDDKNFREIAQRRPLPNPGRTVRPKPVVHQKNPSLEIEDSEYDISKNGITLKHNIFAIKNDQQLPSEYQLIEEKLGYYIVQTQNSPKDALGVVAIEGSKHYAIFTGVLKIKFFNIEQAGDIVADFPGRVSEDYSYINTLLVQFDQFEETMLAFDELKKHPGVSGIEIELLQFQRTSK